MSRKIFNVFAVAVIFTSASFAESENGKEHQLITSKTVTFDSAEVVGHIGNPQVISITLVDGQEEEPLTIDRSFKDMLSENIDKESIARISSGE